MGILKANDILFAHKALNLVPGLSANTRRVAAAIIDHFNKKTGQCDPSIGRLAKLLGIDRATVLRATETLCKPTTGLFRKSSHGGGSSRASYTPCWDVFQEIVADWDERMIEGKAPSKVAELRRSQSQDCDLGGGRTATQTLRTNLSKKPLEGKPLQHPPSNSRPPTKAVATVRLTSGEQNRLNAPPFLLPINGGRSPSHREAAMAVAEKRWTNDLLELGEEFYARYVECATEHLSATASRAELQRRGGGLMVIRQQFNQTRRSAHG